MLRTLGLPAVWAAAFLAAVPFFAPIYVAMPGHFAQAGLVERPAVRADGDALARALHRRMVEDFRAVRGSSDLTVDGWRTDVTKCSLGTPTLVDRQLRFDLDCDFVQQEPRPVIFNYPFPTFIGADGLWTEGETTLRVVALRYDRGPDVKGISFPYPQAEDFFLSPRPVWAPPGVGVLRTTPSEERRIRAFVAAVSGDPSAFSGSWARFLYFSAVTITTLGFGDIVPVTDLARLVVALEVVLGVVIAGMFLNAVAGKAAANVGVRTAPPGDRPSPVSNPNG